MIKNRPHSGLNRVTRFEMYTRLNVTIPVIGPMVEEAYRKHLRKVWREKLNDSPHGHKWHESFHASQFPGDDPKACPRKAMYIMADAPRAEPPSRRLVLTAEAGLAIEASTVTALHTSGDLISLPPSDGEGQTGFTIPEVWLTGTVDSAVAIRGMAVPVEQKTKHESVIEEMRFAGKGPDQGHVNQLKTQLGLVRDAQLKGELWTDLKLCEYGYIFYQPRDTKYDPRFPVPSAEFIVQYDEKWFETGLKVLAQWMENWQNEVLVSVEGKTKRDAKHPMNWLWSYDPCKYCDYKVGCKLDHQAGITSIRDSHVLELAKEINPSYDFDEAKARVEARWNNSDSAPAKSPAGKIEFRLPKDDPRRTFPRRKITDRKSPR